MQRTNICQKIVLKHLSSARISLVFYFSPKNGRPKQIYKTGFANKIRIIISFAFKSAVEPGVTGKLLIALALIRQVQDMK